MPKSRIRVAVIGGGCAALTAAFELTRPQHNGRYEVTIYQMGWRLGGKGASGRGPADRIEEHGLHLWMGFYENAFRLMRDCYAERRVAYPNARFADWRDAFTPAPDVGVADRGREGWEFWLAHFPPGQGDPGDPRPQGPRSVLTYLRQGVMLVGELLRSASAMKSGSSVTDSAHRAAPDGPPSATAETLASAATRLLDVGQLATTAALIEATDILRQIVDVCFPQMFRGAAAVPMALIEGLATAARRELDRLVARDGELRRIWQVVDLILACLRGATLNGLAFDPRGFDAINDYDWRDWLRKHGASEQSLDSGFMRGIYDLTFAFENGDVKRPRLAAGVALRGAVRMFFTYRGALFWRMNAGMGDVVFAPLYQVLKHRGVRFEFFHRLRQIKLAPARTDERPYVSALEFDVQARVKGGAEYQPLVDMHGVPSWQSRPDYGQLVNGATLAREQRDFEASWDERRSAGKTLRVTSDFDFAVLGVGGGAVAGVAGELIERDPRWRAMARHLSTVPTQAFQIWMREDVHEIGWPTPAVNLSGFVKPFDTWADMSHLIPEEGWRDRVKAIAYFCGVLPDADLLVVNERVQAEQRERVRANAIQFLEGEVRALWPKATQDGRFRWDLLVSAERREDARNRTVGERRFDSQYWRANITPTDRYVLSLPRGIEYRVSPLEMMFDNLTVAGDWTASGLDSGCIESAVMSGLLAAHAISQTPRLEDIVGYDHP
jgi:uncharacterized protein with NAD-binding domain and iron-sulfur cluster